MTVQDMIQTVAGNIGNRNSGRIGSRPVEDVILDVLNLAVPHCVLEATPDYYNRTCQVVLPVGVNTFELPVLDTDGAEIKIKNIDSTRCYRGDGSPSTLMQVTYKEFIAKTQNYHTRTTGIPSMFSLWGRSNLGHLDYAPSEELTLEMFIETYPIPITNTMLQQALPMDSQWDIVVEAFATAHCYLKLQQTQMYAVWHDLYLKQKASISRDESEKHSKNLAPGLMSRQTTDPLLDPFVSEWN